MIFECCLMFIVRQIIAEPVVNILCLTSTPIKPIILFMVASSFKINSKLSVAIKEYIFAILNIF